MYQLTFPVPGNLGTNEGADSDGVLIGALASTAAAKALLQGHAVAGLCITDDGGLYVDETTPFGEATADDVEVLPATPANDDAVYFGHATATFARVDVNLTTDGVGTWTIGYEYWNGSAWTALSGVTDGTSGFVAGATGWMSITFTLPTDWAKCTVDGVNAYWIRGVVSGYSAVTTAPQVGQGYVILADADSAWTDDTTDLGDAGAGDVALLPSYPVVGDAFYVGHGEKFCKFKITLSQARTGTATIVAEYWNGTAWADLGDVDDSVGFSAGTSTYLVHFEPPSDWAQNEASNGPNGETGFFIRFRLSAMTSVTAQPLGTQGWVLPLVTGADGVQAPSRGRFVVTRVNMQAATKSGTSADSKFILVNVTTGAFVSFTWTKADFIDQADISLAVSTGDKLALVQIQEDGTTEFADATFIVTD